MSIQKLKKHVCDVIESRYGFDHISYRNGVYTITIKSKMLDRNKFEYQGLIGMNQRYVEDVIEITKDMEVIRDEIEQMYDNTVVKTIMIDKNIDNQWGCNLIILV